MTAVALSTIRDDIQSTLYNIISSDNTVKTYTKNVYDGRPPSLAEGTGFPYIIIHTSALSKTPLTDGINRKYIMASSTTIELYDKQEGVLRELIDAVEHALLSNQTTTRQNHMFNLQMTSANPSSRTQPNGSNVWNCRLSVNYRVVRNG